MNNSTACTRSENELVSISNHTLSSLLSDKHRNIQVPQYDRAHIKTGIVHIGVGGFHRSHQAKYIDTLLNQGEENAWGICGVGIMPQDETLSKALHAQDCLYSLTERSGSSDTCQIIGSITDHILGLNEPKKVFEKIADKDTKIVSLTVTEGGYYIDESTGELDLENPKIKNDLLHPESPQTVYGFLIQGLMLRKQQGNGPVTILCCDNIQHNGEVVKKAVSRFTQNISKDLLEWIHTSVSFPNSMVDRITPVPGEAEQNFVRDTFHILDSCPVVSESFTQWIIEDNFIAGRPQLEKVGVQFVKDVIPFERMKIRLLNASHSAMGYLGYLLGYRYIHEIAQAKEFRPYLLRFMDQEMTPLVGTIPGVDLEWYKSKLIERFSNQDIRDTALRICSGGSAKIPGFVLPAIQEAINQEKPIRAMTCVVASWLRFIAGKDEEGNEIPLEDPQAERLKEISSRGGNSVTTYLEMKDIFGSLSTNERFRDELQFLLSHLYEKGARATLEICS